MEVDRVGVVLKKFDIPAKLPVGFYCRRERAENATAQLQNIDDEHVFSDVFFLRIFETNRDCKAVIYLPLYKHASDKTELVLRLMDSENADKVVGRCTKENQVSTSVIN